MKVRNKKDERGVAVRNKARLVAQGHRQEEGIDYDEVFAHVGRIEAIRILLAFTSYTGFIVYQMDVKSAFLYGTINEEVYVTQPLGFVDPKFPNKVYKVVKALYGLHQAPIVGMLLCLHSWREKSWCDEFEELMNNRFQMSSMGELTFFLRLQTASASIETQKPLVKDKEVADVDVTPKTSHLQVVKRIFRYLKGQPKLGLWYPKVSSFNLEAYSDSDYAGVNLDRKSITGGCQFLGRRLISWQCKKQTIVATSTIEAEYVAAAHYSALLKGRLLEVTTAKQRQGESIEQEIAIKQRIDEDAEDLKRHLHIVANNDDDVYTEATPLASKRVKERFETTEPNNFSNNFLLNILKIMFEKPNVEASVWKDQKGRYGLSMVKSLKLFESCGVHIITFTTTQMILLDEKKYPLTHFTL
nr:hypothetical protein [Tanacetum cinerariifolium]GFA35107.1 hypothetical protein [Tanacetum cinerariifolium]